MEKLKRKAVFDRELGIYRICWTLDSICPGCGRLVENIFRQRPCMLLIMKARDMPCEHCLRKLEKGKAANRKSRPYR